MSVELTAAAPEIAEGWLTEQDGASTDPEGLSVIAHVSATAPVNPPVGVIVMVEVPLAPEAAMLMGAALIVKVVPSTGTTVSWTLVDSTVLPAVPVTVAV